MMVEPVEPIAWSPVDFFKTNGPWIHVAEETSETIWLLFIYIFQDVLGTLFL